MKYVQRNIFPDILFLITIRQLSFKKTKQKKTFKNLISSNLAIGNCTIEI